MLDRKTCLALQEDMSSYMHVYYACLSNILVVSDGMYSIALGGLQADLSGGRLGVQRPPQEEKLYIFLRAADHS